jgi:hypothetical protein
LLRSVMEVFMDRDREREVVGVFCVRFVRPSWCPVR